METAATPTDGEATEAVVDGLNLPTDAFVEILLRLTPICRRRVRLVCRHWHDVINERTPQIQPPKVLAFFRSPTSSSAHVVDDLSRCTDAREVWGVSTVPGTKKYIDINMVGTCNGLLCLCNCKKPGGVIVLLNPATGENLGLPPLLISYRNGKGYRSWQTYSFGFDPTTWQYKILHLPCHDDASEGFNVLQAFTLGDPADASWRDVAVPGASCCSDAGIVCVAGKTYWVTGGVERVVCFDLKDERVQWRSQD